MRGGPKQLRWREPIDARPGPRELDLVGSHGANFGFGIGYEGMLDYFERELRGNVRVNGMLDVVARRHGLPRDRIVPAIVGSFLEHGYLRDMVGLERTVFASRDIEIAVTRTPEGALKLRQYAPILLPLDCTRDVIRHANRFSKRGYAGYVQAAHEMTNVFQSFLSHTFRLPFERIVFHLGADECIKLAFRALSDAYGRLRVFTPLPNYFDALDYMIRFGHTVVPGKTNIAGRIDDNIAEWSAKAATADAVYLSNPNNPLGYCLSIEHLIEIIKHTKPGAWIMIDGTNMHLPDNLGTLYARGYDPMYTTPWRELERHFPDRHFIFIRSFSKSHLTAPDRVGFCWTSQTEDANMLRRYEPMFMPQTPVHRVWTVVSGDSIAAEVTWRVDAFYARLHHDIPDPEKRGLYILPSESNFFIVVFTDREKQARFFEEVAHVRLPGCPHILGLPLRGGGELMPEDINSDGTLADTVFGRPGIIALPENLVRISTLSPPAIIRVLDEVTKG